MLLGTQDLQPWSTTHMCLDFLSSVSEQTTAYGWVFTSLGSQAQPSPQFCFVLLSTSSTVTVFQMCPMLRGPIFLQGCSHGIAEDLPSRFRWNTTYFRKLHPILWSLNKCPIACPSQDVNKTLLWIEILAYEHLPKIGDPRGCWSLGCPHLLSLSQHMAPCLLQEVLSIGLWHEDWLAQIGVAMAD
jgi:hypothetical protein